MSTQANTQDGLTPQEALRRLRANGPNELASEPPQSQWRRALAQFQDPLVYLLLAAIGIALTAWWMEGRVGWPIDAMVIAVMVVLNGMLGFVQQAKADRAVAALQRMTAATSAVMRGGQAVRVRSAELVVGDLLVLGEGDSVGADAGLIQTHALGVLEASLTGESKAIQNYPATLDQSASLGDQLNRVFKGTSLSQGTGLAVVTACGMQTEMGQIAHMLQATVEPPTPLQTEVARGGRMLGVQRMAKHHAIVKKLSSVETLGCASVIASDKTGTLTRAEMTIQKIITAASPARAAAV